MLNRIPDRYFEVAGTICGLLASLSIAAQVYAEFSTETPSTLSIPYAAGFLFIFMFWALYGLRFRRTALWVTNGVATAMQVLLIIAILTK